jgi:hypothetical protein
MKLQKSLLLVLFAITVAFSSCKKSFDTILPAPAKTETKKDGNSNITDGTYRGTFKITDKNPPYTTNTWTFYLTIQNNKYQTGGFGDVDGRGGNFTFTKDNITFIDDNVATADWDYMLILESDYQYTFDGTNLTMWSERYNAHNEYNLVREQKIR